MRLLICTNNGSQCISLASDVGLVQDKVVRTVKKLQVPLKLTAEGEQVSKGDQHSVKIFIQTICLRWHAATLRNAR